ncbi:DUF4272 domain-containing protein [Pelomonas sp. SE-A7]|uniref:DUF4272 domain-containing protein n=1 Tax=Pelomonas sp. SE-A7 TaxID=3054953 RepID=UPI00259C9F76|nr:DUF4272 domain-containing protein [Pelomonas sp. SE-A7]MDM4767194.1 DUF4272 domain-containing protein [Pelomonas sp. SE-A7]
MSSVLDEEPEDEIRDAAAIARRAMALFVVVAISLGAERRRLTEWLRVEDLWAELSPIELAFVESDEPSDRQIINASWRSEALLVLLWSLELIPSIPSPAEICDPELFKAIMPPYVEQSAQQFIASARRRSDDELLGMSEALLDFHWEARDAAINGVPNPNVHIGIAQERHHGINWVVGYCGLPWDEVTTDT